VVGAHGVGGVTGELIAEAAGLNRVTLYRRGHTPQAVVLAAAEAAANRFLEAALVPLTHSGTAADPGSAVDGHMRGVGGAKMLVRGLRVC
jgi:AcrR family transcriptional regulator